VAAFAALVCLFFVATLRDAALGLAPIASALPASITQRDAAIDALAVDEDEAPLEGASIRVFALVDGTAYFAAALETTAEGRARFSGLPRGEAWIVGYARGRARAATRVVLGEGRAEARLVLEPARALDVVVVDELDAPIPGAHLTLTASDPLPFVATTDRDGRARLDRLAAPPYVLRTSAPGYDESTRTGLVAGPTPLRVRLTRLGSIEVTVLGVEGEPVEFATVLAAGSGLWPARSTETDARGRAHLAGLRAGVYDLKARLGDLVSPTEIAIALKRGETREVTLTLEAGRRVRVLVTDGEGDEAPPVAGASVVLTEGGLSSFPLEGVTGEDGSVTLGPLGLEGATAGARAPGFVARSAVIVSDVDTEVRVPLLRGGALVGDVVDDRGYPVDGATLEVVGVDVEGMPIAETSAIADLREGHFALALAGPLPLVPMGELGVMPGPVPDLPRDGAFALAAPPGAAPPEGGPTPWITRTDGTFRLEPVPPGRVHVIARHPSYVEAVSEVVAVRSGEEATVHLVMREGGTLEGRVLDASRRPVAGARVELASQRGSLERVTYTADDGAFAFAAVPEEVLVSAARPEAPADTVVRQSVTLEPRERKEIELILPEQRDEVALHVIDDRGYPLDRVEVHAMALDAAVPLRTTVFTNDDGDAELADAVGLPLRLVLTRPGAAPRVLDVDDAPKKLDVMLTRGITGEGLVTARDGRDRVEGADVVVYTRAGAKRARTDADGAFSIEDLAPGRVRVRATREGFAPREIVVTVGDDPTRPSDLGALDLLESGEVAGVVVDAEGEPVAGARVAQDGVPTYLPLGPLPPGIAATDRDGRFLLKGLPEGEVVLEAFAADYGRGNIGGVPVRAGRTTSTVTIALPGTPSSRDVAGAGSLAVTLGENTGDDGEKVVVIVMVPPGSEAEVAGLEPGDQVIRVFGRPVASLEEARAAFTGPLSEDVIVALARDEGDAGVVTWTARVRRERVRR
jgi:protocatechuate 3,4-dioxygenase beta subunit